MKIDYNKETILDKLNTSVIGKNLLFFEEIDSTSDYLKNNAIDLQEGTVVITRSQTSGRGRRGNTWENGENDAIFMSVLLKPNMKFDSILRISLVCSLSILQALKDTGLNLGIKWPNDIILNEKKVCGILTECVSSIDLEISLILGIGLNVHNKSFSKEIEHKATSLELEGIDTDIPTVVAKILKQIEKNYYTYLQYGFKYFIEEYKKYCVNINKDVAIINGTEHEYGMIIDINNDGTLLFKNKDGQVKNIMSNEVSVRGLNGYV